MNKQGNTYTLIYTAVMVIVVAFILAFAAIGLKPAQQKNIAIDKMSQILNSVNIVSTPENAQELYGKYIDDSFVVDANGQLVKGESFSMNIADQLKLPESQRTLPIFICTDDSGSPKYIIPLSGAGLWGPIWGYISIENDGNTVYGAYFAHQSETPGLGAEIEKPQFQKQFQGKHFFIDGAFMPIAVEKAGRKPQNGADYVDAVSGGTITSKGVQSMLQSCVEPSKNNPVIVQILGICSALAVTAKLEPALVMAVSVTAVVAFANVIISLLRNTIPNSIRIIVQLVVVAALVIIVDQVLKAYMYQVSKQLSVFVGLIITNCILMGRLEAFALSHKPWESFLDGVGNGVGYGIILVIVAFFRELLGSGTLFGYQVIPQQLYDWGYQNNGLMILPPMALITVACIIWVHRSRNKDLQQ